MPPKNEPKKRTPIKQTPAYKQMQQKWETAKKGVKRAKDYAAMNATKFIAGGAGAILNIIVSEFILDWAKKNFADVYNIIKFVVPLVLGASGIALALMTKSEAAQFFGIGLTMASAVFVGKELADSIKKGLGGGAAVKRLVGVKQSDDDDRFVEDQDRIAWNKA